MKLIDKSKQIVDLVIISYNTLPYLKECIESIRMNTLHPYRIIVVDNKSTDGSLDYLRKFSNITLIENKRNYGYAKACNQGIMAGEGEFVVLLNTDLKMSQGWLTALVKTARSDEKIGVVAPKLVNEKDQLVGAGVTQLDTVCPPRGWHQKDRIGLYDKVEDCYSVSGACYLIRRKALEKVGAFDENYFFYFEETDLSLRMLEKGYRVIYCPNAKLLHYHEGSLLVQKNARIQKDVRIQKHVRVSERKAYSSARKPETNSNERIKRNLYFKESQHRFLKKWQDVLGGAPRRKESRDIVVFGVIPWNYRYQRPQQLCSRLAKKGYRIFYISNTCEPGGKLEEIADNIYTFSPDGKGVVYYNLNNLMSCSKIITSINTVLTKLNFLNPIILVHVPYWQKIISYFDYQYIIYDCMDAYEDFSDLRRFCPDLKQREEDLAKSAEIIFASSTILFDKLKKFNKNTFLLRNGVDYEHFDSQIRLKKPDDIVKIPKPIIGYHGAIAEWFDLELIEYAARKLPNNSFVLIGRHTVEINRLARLKNVYFLGEKPYQQLPKYVQHFDVAIIPFKKNQLTLSTNPVKLYEYLASGKPVVSVDLPEIRLFKNMIHISRDSKEFVSLLGKAMKNKIKWIKNVRVSERRKAMKSEDWNQRVDEMINRMNQQQLVLQNQSRIIEVTDQLKGGNKYE